MDRTPSHQMRRTPVARLLLCAALGLGVLLTTVGCDEPDAYESADQSDEVARTEERVERDGERVREEARSAVEDLHGAASDVEREAERLAEELEPEE